MIPAENIAQEYRDRLKTITTDNGYHSDAGKNIYEGWLAHALVDDSQQPYPFIAIQPARETRDDKSAGGRMRLTLSQDIIVAERVESGVATQLHRHAHDLRVALTDRNNADQLGGHAVSSRVGDVEYQIPENGYPVAWVALTVSATYLLTIDP